MSRRVWVVGSVTLDHVFRSPALPRPAETILGSGYEEHPGGKGANQAAASARLGAPTRFVGCIGDDDAGSIAAEALKEAGVDLAGLRRLSSHPTARAGIFVDAQGQNSIVVAPCANSQLTVERAAESLTPDPDDVVLSQLEVPIETVIFASRLGRFILNPAPAQPLPDEVLANCWVITPNEIEAEQLTGVAVESIDSCRQAAKTLLNRGVKNVVITLGDRGCYWTDGKGEAEATAPKVETVDATAAGDVFSGALARCLALGMEIREALPWANRAAAISTTRFGALTSIPHLAELENDRG